LASFALTFSDIEFGKAFNAVITSANNNGPFFGLSRATTSEVSELSSFAKVILMVSMIAGRIEFVSFFMVLVKPFWKR
jgi:Trk-type K+ transport system membrane component